MNLLKSAYECVLIHKSVSWYVGRGGINTPSSVDIHPEPSGLPMIEDVLPLL